MPYSNPNFVAGGTIAPCRFVSIFATGSTPADFTIWQATDGTASHGDLPFGVSQEGTDLWSSANAAVAGEEVRVFGPGETCLLELGGTVTAGDPLKPDANGKGIVSGTTATGIPADLDKVGAFALQSGISGTKIQVRVHPYIA